jgi:hypothetical protein
MKMEENKIYLKLEFYEDENNRNDSPHLIFPEINYNAGRGWKKEIPQAKLVISILPWYKQTTISFWEGSYRYEQHVFKGLPWEIKYDVPKYIQKVLNNRLVQLEEEADLNNYKPNFANEKRTNLSKNKFIICKWCTFLLGIFFRKSSQSSKHKIDLI